MILRTRRWLGGSSYALTVSPGPDRLPLPGEAVVLADMGRVRVMSARDIGGERRLVVRDRDIGPSYDNLTASKVAVGGKNTP